MEKIDVGEVLGAVTASAVIGQFVELEKSGSEFKACCPFHEEKTASFSVSDKKGFYYCFGCGAGGDPIDFVQKIKGCGFREAVDIIQGSPQIQAQSFKKTPEPESQSWTPILPIPADISIPENIKHYKHGIPSQYWKYFDQHGNLLGLVCRFEIGTDPETGETKKTLAPFVFAQNCTSRRWRWLSFPKPRPLYGLWKINQDTKNVIIVEGEKSADAAQSLFPSIPVITWPGGGKAVQHADWSPLSGKKVVIWPDRDPPGLKTAIHIAELISEISAGIKIVQLPAGPADGWDAADTIACGWNPAEAMAWLKSSLKDVGEYRDLPAPWDITIQETNDHQNQQPEYDYPDIDEEKTDESQFICLGYDHGEYYYWSRGSQQVLCLSGSGHTKGNLLTLAPLQFWEREYPGRNGASWDSAANALIRSSERAGIYDPYRIRGRGAWWDGTIPLLHMGDKLVVDSEFKPLNKGGGRYIYEAAAPFPLNLENPLQSKEAIRLVDFVQMLPWEKPINAILFAGWCVIAPICGALKWRPHIWITGGAGVGKSWIFDNVLKRCLGDIALQVQSETTEAGIRQVLGQDARPIIFDEAESEDYRAQSRIQNVMALMRQSSSESGASIFKGSATGASKEYRIRSCFAFASIGVGLQQHADKTRVSILSLVADNTISPAERNTRFEAIQEAWFNTLTPEFVDRLHARVVRLIPQIRKNAETFAVAGSQAIGTRRLGDQIGALLAGAHALYSANEISMEAATEWISKQDWSEEAALQSQKDEEMCAKYILEYELRISGDHGKNYTHSIGELIQIVDNTISPYSNSTDKVTAEETLRRHGIRVEFQRFVVSNNHSGIEKILRGTAWSKNWARILRRLEKAETTEPMRFGSGIQSRGISLPTDMAIGD